MGKRPLPKHTGPPRDPRINGMEASMRVFKSTKHALWVAGLTFIVAGAAATAFAQSRATDFPGRAGIFSSAADGSITLLDMDLNCESKQGGGSAGPTGKHDSCSDIPVIVLESTNGSQCWSHLPYNRLVVHRKNKGGNPRDVVIEWHLLQTDRFKFDTSKRGIDLKPTKQNSTGPDIDPEKDHYADRNVSEKRIKWKLNGTAPKDFKFGHDAQVIRKADNLPCTAIDPLITNAD
jgi:hypothetical protein